MKIGSTILEIIKSAPSVLLLALGVLAFFTWSHKSNLELEIEDLTLRDIQITAIDSARTPLRNVSLSVEPMYSFDEIKPKYTMTLLGEGRAKISVCFVRQFKLRVGADGYIGKVIEYQADSPPELHVMLEPIVSKQSTTHN